MNEQNLQNLQLLESPNARYLGRRVIRSPQSSPEPFSRTGSMNRLSFTPSSRVARKLLIDDNDDNNINSNQQQKSQIINNNNDNNNNDNAFIDNNDKNIAANQTTKPILSNSMDEDEEIFNQDYANSMQQALNFSTRRSFGDRFIPSRTNFDVDVSNYNLRRDDALANGNLDTSPAKEEYKRTLSVQLFGAGSRNNVLPTQRRHSSGEPLRSAAVPGVPLLDAQTRSRARAPQRKCHRTIARTPLRILDAPHMLEDYYLNLLDWSKTNILAVALNQAVYLWNAQSGAITKLVELRTPDSYIASLKWSAQGDCLAVGTSESDVQLWDVTALKRVRSLDSHQGRVSVLAWHQGTLASGSRDALVQTHDPRVDSHVTATLAKHTQEVCGLSYSSEGQLASGGNDNLLCIWDPHRTGTPRHTFTHHQAAVKGIAWCPWQQNLLASGGGTADRTIRFWDTSTGACLNSVDTKSQVCSIIWSPHYRELVSSHGFSQNQLILWKYNSMVKVCELTGHTSRVLHMALSPDGETVVSASGDETLRFWKLFERRRAHDSKRNARVRSSLSLPSITLR